MRGWAGDLCTLQHGLIEMDRSESSKSHQDDLESDWKAIFAVVDEEVRNGTSFADMSAAEVSRWAGRIIAKMKRPRKGRLWDMLFQTAFSRTKECERIQSLEHAESVWPNGVMPFASPYSRHGVPLAFKSAEELRVWLRSELEGHAVAEVTSEEVPRQSIADQDLEIALSFAYDWFEHFLGAVRPDDRHVPIRERAMMLLTRLRLAAGAPTQSRSSTAAPVVADWTQWNTPAEWRKLFYGTILECDDRRFSELVPTLRHERKVDNRNHIRFSSSELREHGVQVPSVISPAQ